MRKMTMSALLVLLVALPSAAMADGSKVTSDNYACLKDGDADAKAHYAELTALAQYRASVSHLHPSAAVLMLGKKLQQVGLPGHAGHESYHGNAREMAETLVKAGLLGDPEKAQAAYQAYMAWRTVADGQHLSCPLGVVLHPADNTGSMPLSGSRSGSGGNAGTSPTRSASTILRHAESHKDDPQRMIAGLRTPASQRTLSDAGKLEASGRLVLDAVIDAEYERLKALSAASKSSHAAYDAAIAAIDAAVEYAVDANVPAYRQSDVVAFKAAIYKAKAEL